MTEGERVRWHLLALGNQEDIHTPHWHGQTLLLGNPRVGGRRVDVVNLLPATHLSLEHVAENPGTWLYHCHVNHHIHAGMTAMCAWQRRRACRTSRPVRSRRRPATIDLCRLPRAA